MRENTKKLLTWLYPVSKKIRLVSRLEIDLIWKELTLSGRKSLLYHLNKEGLIEPEMTKEGEKWRVTEWGKSEIELEMPVLRDLKREDTEDGIHWQLIILGETTPKDLEFRKLRNILKANNALMLTRGVYLYPNKGKSIEADNLKTMFGKYLGSMWITAEADFVFGDLRQTILSRIEVKSLIRSYSGVSKELEALLRIKDLKKTPMHKVIDKKMTIYDRLFYVGCDDGGSMALVSHYDVLNFGKCTDFRYLLQALQSFK